MPLRDWLKHLIGVDMWPVVVSRPYTRAAADLEIAELSAMRPTSAARSCQTTDSTQGEVFHLPLNASHLQGLGGGVTSETDVAY
jgi:hypothetical protein